MSASPANDPKPTVVVCTNDTQLLAARIAVHALTSRSRHPERFEVRLLRFEETPELFRRDGQSFRWWEGDAPAAFRRRDAQSFAALRRSIPQLLGFRGRALVMDPDVFAVGDVWELLSRDMDGKAILCRRQLRTREGRPLWSSGVMLLECGRLTDWQWERDVDAIFRGALPLGPWLALLDQPPERIGMLEDVWNDFDRLADDTKLLHTTEITTQPWKTGLPADSHRHAPRCPPLIEGIRRRLARLAGMAPPVYRPHPDPRQERLFFRLLQECLDAGSITLADVRHAMRRNYLRKDALAVLRRLR
jgi:hypothetical protein